MASEPAEMDSASLEAFSTVWVKMEVEEDGTVEGIDQQETEESNQGTEDNYQETDGNDQQTEDSSQEVRVLPRRSRRKPAAPRKAKNVEQQIFQCEYCDYKAMHKSSLKYHLLKHTNPDPIPCSACSYTTNHAASLRRHTLSVHTPEDDPAIQALPDKKCKDCDFTCKFSWKLFMHKKKHEEKSFHCQQCDFSTARKSNFDKHCRTHRHKESITYECDKCPFVTKHEGHISRHLAVIHKEVSENASKCDHCEFSTKVRWRLNIHKKNSRQEKPIKCEYCDFVTDYNCEYKLHKQQHISDMALVASGLKLPIEDMQNSVIIQIQKPKGRAAMTESSTDETYNEREFIVDTACEEIDWRSIEVGEKPGEEKPFHCILCPYQSKFKASVQRHFQRNHTSANSKPYKCVNCDFSTKTRDQISLHNKRSKSIYQISCKECEFTTFYKCQMAEHQRVHWQFKCKLCEFVCRVSYDLNTHYTVVHLGQGLKCRFCDFQAARKGSLLNHENTHTSKRFRCGLCDYSATRRNLLFNHMKKCHAGEKPKIIISDRKFELLKKVGEVRSGESDLKNVDDMKNLDLLKHVQCSLQKIERDLNHAESDFLKCGESDLKNTESDFGNHGESDLKKDESDFLNRGESDLKNVESDFGNHGESDSKEVESQNEFERGDNNESAEGNVESGSQLRHVETQVYIERQTDYERKHHEFQSNTMYGEGW